MKKVLFALLTLVIAAIAATAVFGAPFFRDVPESEWYYKEVKAANDAGLMVGKTATAFDPEGLVTRAEIAAILSRIEGADVTAAAPVSFPDVKDGDWFRGYIFWAARSGILRGYEDGTVRPDSPITREELAVMITRYADGKGLALPTVPRIDAFADEAKISDWARDAAETTRRAGIFGGDAAGRFSPSSNATRAEVAALSTRLLSSIETAENTVLIAERGKKTDFVLVVSDGDGDDADEFVSAFLVTKKTLAVVSDTTAPAAREIVLFRADRPESEGAMEGVGKYEYRIRVTASDDRVAVNIAYNLGLARREAFRVLFADYWNGYELRLPKDLDRKESYPFTKERGEASLIGTDVDGLRDPFVLVEGDTCYMYGTGWRAYKNVTGDLAGHWEPLGRVVEDPDDFKADRWAPEVYRVGDGYVMFTTYTSKETGLRGVAVFGASSPEGPFRIVSDGAITPKDWSSIDGTLYVDPDGQPWMVFVHEHVSLDDHIGRMAAAKLSDDLSSFISEPVELFRADDPSWSHANITDGPFMYECGNGDLLMIWSNDDEYGYCVGVARSENGRVDGKWEQLDARLYSLDLSGFNPGGHGMIFRAPDGDLYLSFHAPNVKVMAGEKEKPYFLKIREENGELVWDD